MNAYQTTRVLGSFPHQSTSKVVLSLVEWLGTLSADQRATCFQVLVDFYCPRCGIEQPEGDCQCHQTT